MATKTRITAAIVVMFTAAVINAAFPQYNEKIPLARLDTPQGSIYAARAKVPAYQSAIAFVHDSAARGLKTLCVPEDVSLHFFTLTLNPTSAYVLAPGAVSPGHPMEELLDEMETSPVHYVLWSNRQAVEYGDPKFGVDYNRELGDYIRTYFRPVAHLGVGTNADELTEPVRFYRADDWHATIWERVSSKSPNAALPALHSARNRD